jgi:hypothetical protein
VGRFTSEDPVSGLATMPQTLNPYAYGYGNPLAYPDPYGECPICLAALPVLTAVGEAIAADYALNMGVEAAHYLTTRPEDKPFDFRDFANTVTGEGADATVEDLKDPLTFSPLHKFGKVSDVLRLADKPVWPKTAEEMDELLKIPGSRVPDKPYTPGRDKAIWQPSDKVRKIREQHPYHPNAPSYHIDPHYHLDTPGKKYQKYMPGDEIPGY